MTAPWQVQRSAEAVPSVSHCLVDSHPGLLLYVRGDRAWVVWADEPGAVVQQWVDVSRVERLG